MNILETIVISLASALIAVILILIACQVYSWEPPQPACMLWVEDPEAGWVCLEPAYEVEHGDA